MFPTSNVFFDFRVPPDVGFPLATHEFDIYFNTLGVPLPQNFDFLLRISATGTPGETFAGYGAQFIYSNSGNPFFRTASP